VRSGLTGTRQSRSGRSGEDSEEDYALSLSHIIVISALSFVFMALAKDGFYTRIVVLGRGGQIPGV
jgi:hypothetical protein